MAPVHHLIVRNTAVRASQIPMSPPAVHGPARRAVRIRVATLRLAIVRPKVAARRRQPAGSAWGKPVRAPFRIVPEPPAQERNRAQLAATRSLGRANESTFSRRGPLLKS